MGLEVNIEKTKYMVMSQGQKAGQNGNREVISPLKLWKFKYLGTTLVNQNSMYEEIKSRLTSGNACYHSVQNILSSSLLSKSVNIKIYRTIILPVVLYGCQTWLLTLREECRLRIFENRVLRRIFGPKRDEVTWELGRLHNNELYALYSSPVKKIEMDRACSMSGEEERCIQGFSGET
jgi:hypothetical protein